MQVGYARVSTHDQDPATQLDGQKATGRVKIFTEKASGNQRDWKRLPNVFVPRIQYKRPAVKNTC